MTNKAIADHLNLISDLMELHSQNSFRAKSYSIAAFQISKLDSPLSEMDDHEIFSQKNVGESVGKKIVELLETGHITVLDEFIQQTPPGVLDLLKVKGIGPKKIAQLWSSLGIESLSDLELAAVENRLVDIKGFGAKTQQKILDSIAFIHKSKGFVLYATACQTWLEISNDLSKKLPQFSFLPTGQFYNQEDIIAQMDIVTNASPIEIKKWAEAIFIGIDIKESNDTITIASENYLPIYFYLTTQDQLFYQQVKLSCAKEIEDKLIITHGNSEQEIFENNQLEYLHPALRQQPLGNISCLDKLIETSDIKGLIHCHSQWSDGIASIEQMANECIKKGLEYMVITDHSKSAFYANGLNEERIKEQHAEIDVLNQKLAPFKIYKSIEADILNDGSLDYSDEVLDSFDCVIASVHTNLGMTIEQATQRILTAIKHPKTTILGHPTGRLLLSREGYPLHMEQIIDACAEHNVVIEINANPRRLDLDWRWIQYAIKQGVLLSINPDAHSIEGINDIKYGVIAAQKGGLTRKNNLSSFTLNEFEQYLG